MRTKPKYKEGDVVFVHKDKMYECFVVLVESWHFETWVYNLISKPDGQMFREAEDRVMTKEEATCFKLRMT